MEGKAPSAMERHFISLSKNNGADSDIFQENWVAQKVTIREQ
jgi:hypothetical protein